MSLLEWLRHSTLERILEQQLAFTPLVKVVHMAANNQASEHFCFVLSIKCVSANWEACQTIEYNHNTQSLIFRIKISLMNSLFEMENRPSR